MKFSELELIEPLLNAVKEMKYDIPHRFKNRQFQQLFREEIFLDVPRLEQGKQQLLLYRFYKNYIYVMKAKSIHELLKH